MTRLSAPFSVRAAVLAVALLAAPFVRAAEAVTVPGDYPTIQAAIDAVVNGSLPDGTTITVLAGVYNEAVTIASTGRSFTLRGAAGAGSTIVDASGRNKAALTVFRASGQVIIRGLTFRHGAVGALGGGGFLIQESSPSLIDTVFELNSADHGGGGLLATSNATFTGCVIRNNTATRSGGGIYMTFGSRPVFTATDIVSNQAGVGPPGTSNSGVGGGIDSRNSSPTFRGSRVSANTAKFAGGGIYHGGEHGSPYGTATLLMEDSEVADNLATPLTPGDNPAEGGGIHIEDNSVGTLTRTRVLRNRANTGGGLNAYRARYDLVDSLVDGNQALARSDGGIPGGIGGGITASSTNVGEVRPSSVVNLTGTLVRNNVGITGGGIVVTGDVNLPATLTLTLSVVDSNQSQNQGGGVLLSNANLSSNNSMIIRNAVAGGQSPFGGGLMITTSSTATLNGTTIARNAAGVYGGGIFMDQNAGLSMSTSQVYDNTANLGNGFGGGGLFVGPNGNNFGTVQNSIIADNGGYQVVEHACPQTRLTYNNNTITPRSGNNDLYSSSCNPFLAQSTIAQFNALANTSGNNSNLPRFVQFLAVPRAGTSSTLVWSAGRATGATISGVGSFNGNTGTADVSPVGSTTYTLTASASQANGGNYGPVSLGFTVVLPPSATRSVAGDFDGDGTADLTVYRPSNGTWYHWFTGSSTSGGMAWGIPGDKPVSADYDGDGKTDRAVFRPSNGTWYIWFSTSNSAGGFQSGFGTDVPVPADYDGDGRADVAVFRPSNGTWFIWFSSTGSAGGLQSGFGTDIPAPADYDGDGRADIAVFRPSNGTWFIWFSSTGTTGGVQWGSNGDVPVPRDYNGDGKADVAVYRPSTGVWYMRYSSGGMGGAQWGASGDVPVPGDYNGDGRADVAVFRPSNGVWYLSYWGTNTTGGALWGASGDIPVLPK